MVLAPSLAGMLVYSIQMCRQNLYHWPNTCTFYSLKSQKVGLNVWRPCSQAQCLFLYHSPVEINTGLFKNSHIFPLSQVKASSKFSTWIILNDWGTELCLVRVGKLTLAGPMIIAVQWVSVMSLSSARPQLTVPSPPPFWPSSSSSSSRKLRGTTTPTHIHTQSFLLQSVCIVSMSRNLAQMFWQWHQLISFNPIIIFTSYHRSVTACQGNTPVRREGVRVFH